MTLHIDAQESAIEQTTANIELLQKQEFDKVIFEAFQRWHKIHNYLKSYGAGNCTVYRSLKYPTKVAIIPRMGDDTLGWSINVEIATGDLLLRYVNRYLQDYVECFRHDFYPIAHQRHWNKQAILDVDVPNENAFDRNARLTIYKTAKVMSLLRVRCLKVTKLNKNLFAVKPPESVEERYLAMNSDGKSILTGYYKTLPEMWTDIVIRDF